MNYSLNHRSIMNSNTPAINDAITALVSEFEILDGSATPAAQVRRTVAMERVTATMFSTITELVDPYGFEDRIVELAEGTLAYSLIFSDVLVTAMLDFREKARLHHHRPDSYRARLKETLMDIWDIALEEVMRVPDEVRGDSDSGNAGTEGEEGGKGFAAAAA